MTRRFCVFACVWMSSSIVLLSGCQMYRVEDTSTGRSYLTSNWQMYQDPWRDTLQFHDVRSGRDVTLREVYQVERLNEVEALHALREQ